MHGVSVKTRSQDTGKKTRKYLKKKRKRGCTQSSTSPILFIVIDDAIHHVHHGLGGTEHGFDSIEPGITLIEVVGHLMPTAVVLLTEIVHVFPVAGKS